MERLTRRTTLLYGTLAFAVLFALLACTSAIGVLVIDRAIAADLHLTASEIPEIAARAPSADFSARSAYIVAHARRAGVDLSVRDTAPPMRDSVEGDFGDGPPPGGPPQGDGGGGFHDGGPGGPQGPPPDDHGPPPGPTGPWHASPAMVFSVPSEHVVVTGATVDIFPSADRLQQLALALLFAVIVGLVASALFALLIGRWLAVRSLEPLGKVVSELFRFGSGDFSERSIDDAGRTDYGDLALAYNAATAQVVRALGEREKAEADMRQFIADAAHELRTPLTVIDGYVQLLRGGIDPASSTNILDTIDAENKRMRELIANLLALARLDSQAVAPMLVTDLSTIVEAALDEVPFLGENNDVRVDVRTDVMVLCEPPAMKEAVTNLLVNATKYARGCTVDVSLKTEGEHAVLAIRDEGPGMSETDRDNAFRRFYRGEFVRDIEGSGLGLSIVDRVVTRARGTIALDTGLGRGTCFTIVLPLAPSA